MSPTAFKPGFSLTEVLMAAGILLVGFLLIAGTFPVGVKLTAVATERTIGVVASEEAMAKIHLYGIDDPTLLPYDRHVPYDGISVAQYQVATNASSFISSTALRQLSLTYQSNPNFSANSLALERYFQYESLYPSTVFFDYSVPANPTIRTDPEDPQRYFWSALCRRLDQTSTEIQVTIFVSRMAGENALYPRFDFYRPTGTPLANPWSSAAYPTPVPIAVTGTVGTELYHRDAAGAKIAGSPVYFSTLTWTTQSRVTMAGYIGPGAMLLDDVNGRLMRVQEVRRPDPAIPTDFGEIRLMQGSDTDGDTKAVIAADLDGLLMFRQSEYAINKNRVVWVVPPAVADMTRTPPRVTGRNPCVGVYQGQL